MNLTLQIGDCLDRMKELPERSISVICCDPPYGLEFMGRDWDKLDWQAGGGFSKPGIGDRKTSWPSFSGMGQFGTANPTCAVCGGRLRGAKRCSCSKPHDHWKPIGKRRNLPHDIPDLSTKPDPMKAMGSWHHRWMVAAYRVLKPGGIIKCFGGTRVFHRLSLAMVEAGFQDVRIDAWIYGSGFPKSHNVSNDIDKGLGHGPRGRAIPTASKHLPSGRYSIEKLVSNPVAPYQPRTPEAEIWIGWGTALKPAWEPVLIGTRYR